MEWVSSTFWLFNLLMITVLPIYLARHIYKLVFAGLTKEGTRDELV